MRIVIAFILCTCWFHANSQQKLEWSATQKLTVSDFRAPTPLALNGQTLKGHIGIETNLSNHESLTNFNERVSNYFYADSSWISVADPSRLKYIQAMFDLNECMARELRKQFAENAKEIGSKQQEIYEAVSNQFRNWELQYNNDTNYGENAIAQMNWELRINEKLQELGIYCKTCKTPPR